MDADEDLPETDPHQRNSERGATPPPSQLPEFVQRALEIGLTGFFTTEQTLRRALGETLPQEWIDFLDAQGERTRKEMTDAVVAELGRSLERLDISEALDTLLAGRTIEINAKIRLGAKDAPSGEEEAGSAGSMDSPESTDSPEATGSARRKDG